jgi:hypothetical protein
VQRPTTVRSDAGPDRVTVADLAREFDQPLDVVESIYREEERRLESARIKTFIGVLVTGRVRAELRRRSGESARDA